MYVVCDVCGMDATEWVHDHKPDKSGLDDGPWLAGRAPRKRPEPKSAAQVSAIRKRALITRRDRYGKNGHR